MAGNAFATPKPELARFFEAAAAVMDLDDGHQTLELVFEDGHLRRWFTHRRAGANELLPFDGRAEWTLPRQTRWRPDNVDG